MRILLLTQWFQPEPQFKGLPLAQALIARGHDVEVLTGFPNYPGGKLYPGYRIRPWRRETMEGVRITRAALYPSHDQSAVRRIFNYASFALSSTILAFSLRRPDVVYVYCPPMTAAAGAIALRLLRRVPYVIDVQDLWPDTLASTGMVRDGLLMRLVGAWSNLAMRHASRLVVLSQGFKQRLENRGIRRPIHVIPNWAPPEIVEQAAALPTPSTMPTEKFNILFAGNMGKAQALETVLNAAEAVMARTDQVRFTFVGGGVEAHSLCAQAQRRGLTNVVFLPARPVREMGPVFAQADALLVHLRDDPLFSITIPSKTQAYLAVGRPILMGVRGDAAAMVRDAGAGIVFEPENKGTLVAAIDELIAMSPEARAAMAASGIRYYEDNLSFDRGVARLEAVLQDAVRQP